MAKPVSNSSMSKKYIVYDKCISWALSGFYMRQRAFSFEDISGVSYRVILAMIILYTVSPLLYRLASSAYYNLSLLSSDFYGLLFGKVYFIFLLPIYLELMILFLRIVPLRMHPDHLFVYLVLTLLHSIIDRSGSTLLLFQLSLLVSLLTSGHPRVSLLTFSLISFA